LHLSAVWPASFNFISRSKYFIQFSLLRALTSTSRRNSCSVPVCCGFLSYLALHVLEGKVRSRITVTGIVADAHGFLGRKALLLVCSGHASRFTHLKVPPCRYSRGVPSSDPGKLSYIRDVYCIQLWEGSGREFDFFGLHECIRRYT